MPIKGTPVEVYLQGRGITQLPPSAHEALRWHPRCPWGSGATCGAMVALYRDVLTDAPTAVHRTNLSARAGEDKRKSLGPIKGAAIKLWPSPGEQLVVGEGIETVLSAATRLPYREPLNPAWAMGDTNGLKGLPVLPGVGRLIILVDNDAHGAGPKAAAALRARWFAAGRTVVELTPSGVEQDFNDIIAKVRL